MREQKLVQTLGVTKQNAFCFVIPLAYTKFAVYKNHARSNGFRNRVVNE